MVFTKAAAVSVVVSVSMFSCSNAASEETADAIYDVSFSGTEELLSLTWEGGSTASVPEYRLHGDGHLIRSIVPQGSRINPVRSDTVALSQGDIDLVMELVVKSGLATPTEEDLEEGKRRSGVQIKDAGTAILRLRFESFQANPESKALVPYTPTVRMAAPAIQASRRPDLREAQGLVSLTEILESYSEISVYDLL